MTRWADIVVGDGLRFTHPQWRGLCVAAVADHHGVIDGPRTDPVAGRVHREVLGWLVDEDLVDTPNPGEWRITARGLKVHEATLAASKKADDLYKELYTEQEPEQPEDDPPAATAVVVASPSPPPSRLPWERSEAAEVIPGPWPTPDSPDELAAIAGRYATAIGRYATVWAGLAEDTVITRQNLQQLERALSDLTEWAEPAIWRRPWRLPR